MKIKRQRRRRIIEIYLQSAVFLRQQDILSKEFKQYTWTNKANTFKK
jgi:hypothetical protein